MTSVIKYYTVKSASTLSVAVEKLQKLQEKHPDRQHTILINMRSSGYRVVRCELVEFEPPRIDVDPPERADFSNVTDFFTEEDAYRNWLRSKWDPIQSFLWSKIGD